MWDPRAEPPGMGRVGDEGKVHLIPAEILSSPLVRLQCAQMAVKPKEHHCSPRGWGSGNVWLGLGTKFQRLTRKTISWIRAWGGLEWLGRHPKPEALSRRLISEWKQAWLCTSSGYPYNLNIMKCCFRGGNCPQTVVVIDNLPLWAGTGDRDCHFQEATSIGKSPRLWGNVKKERSLFHYLLSISLFRGCLQLRSIFPSRQTIC